MRNEHQAHANGYFDLSSFDTDVGVRFGLAEEGRGGWGGTGNSASVDMLSLRAPPELGTTGRKQTGQKVRFHWRQKGTRN